MNRNITPEISHIPAKAVRSYAMDGKTTFATLDKLGLHFPKEHVRAMMNAYGRVAAMDVAPEMLTTPSNGALIQFLQTWLNEPIATVTAKRDIDELVGKTQAGTFFDAEIVQPFIERLGQAQPYGDNNNIPLSSWNFNPEARSIVRFEEGLDVKILEEGQAAKMRINSSEWKRNAAAESLAISANEVGFYGYNDGTNKTYGFLNDPNLPAYKSVANAGTAESPVLKWQDKTMQQICDDILEAVTALQTQSGNNYNPASHSATLAVSLSAYQYLNKLNEFGNKTALQWLKETYPNIRVVASLFLDGVQGGSNVFYLYADRIGNARVIDQYVQDTMRLLGVERRAKGYVEDYANATAGVFVKQPVGIVRRVGI